MLPSNKQNVAFLLFRRKSPNNTPTQFRGIVIGEQDRDEYTPTQGLITTQNGIFVKSIRLPSEIDIDDKVIYMGKSYIVANIGYYVDNIRCVDTSRMRCEDFIRRCPKGIQLV